MTATDPSPLDVPAPLFTTSGNSSVEDVLLVPTDSETVDVTVTLTITVPTRMWPETPHGPALHQAVREHILDIVLRSSSHLLFRDFVAARLDTQPGPVTGPQVGDRDPTPHGPNPCNHPCQPVGVCTWEAGHDLTLPHIAGHDGTVIGTG